jgi:prolyl-tRNA synthetase
MYDTYCRIFQRCGVKYVIVEAESGEMGGSGSHQFTVPCDSGEDIIVHTDDGSYAANIEKAAVDPLPKQKSPAQIPPMEQVHTPDVGSIEAVCKFLHTEPQDMIKTLIYSAGSENKETIVALLRGDHELNPEKLTQLLGGKSNELADEQTITTLTSAVVGFAGPMGLEKKATTIVIDHAVAAMAVGVTGANKTDYHVKNVVPGRDFALQGENVLIADIRNAQEGDTHDGKKLKFQRGIEVGQVFQLGTKYSVKLNARFLDENGVEKPCIMGCYGIGINRIMASAIEIGNDQDGIIWPISIAPFEVLVCAVNQNDPAVAAAAEKIYDQLRQQNIDVLLDDRKMRGGVKFKDADLIGIPIRITVGSRGIEAGTVEIKLRRETTTETIAIDQAAARTVALVKQLYDQLKDR